MPISEAPRVSKLPFLLADLVLVGLGVFLMFQGARPLNQWEILGIVACVVIGSLVGVQPFLREHAAAVKLWEQEQLAGAAEQLGQLADVADRIGAATGQWQTVQETAARTVGVAGELSGQMRDAAKQFTESLQRLSDQEKQTLRLETDKLRRHEQEFLQIMVHLLDHTYALFGAAVRSGQTNVIQQIGQFRAACQDTVRRVGLLSHEARPGDAFDARAHQTADGKEPPAGAKIAGTVACGYTYQGQPVRRILVALQADSVAAPEPVRLTITPEARPAPPDAPKEPELDLPDETPGQPS